MRNSVVILFKDNTASWRWWGYANWIESDAGAIAVAEGNGTPVVNCGEYPDWGRLSE